MGENSWTLAVCVGEGIDEGGGYNAPVIIEAIGVNSQ